MADHHLASLRVPKDELDRKRADQGLMTLRGSVAFWSASLVVLAFGGYGFAIGFSQVWANPDFAGEQGAALGLMGCVLGLVLAAYLMIPGLIVASAVAGVVYLVAPLPIAVHDRYRRRRPRSSRPGHRPAPEWWVTVGTDGDASSG